MEKVTSSKGPLTKDMFLPAEDMANGIRTFVCGHCKFVHVLLMSDDKPLAGVLLNRERWAEMKVTIESDLELLERTN